MIKMFAEKKPSQKGKLEARDWPFKPGQKIDDEQEAKQFLNEWSGYLAYEFDTTPQDIMKQANQYGFAAVANIFNDKHFKGKGKPFELMQQQKSQQKPIAEMLGAEKQMPAAKKKPSLVEAVKARLSEIEGVETDKKLKDIVDKKKKFLSGLDKKDLPGDQGKIEMEWSKGKPLDDEKFKDMRSIYEGTIDQTDEEEKMLPVDESGKVLGGEQDDMEEPMMEKTGYDLAKLKKLMQEEKLKKLLMGE